ncbi:hypothetical protein [Klebsiella quasipneumoniae]|uniref:hypothetical protein n=1 Tax=Klebsiella quasipneumoniae TaxID=1463165 RepID=UPI002DBB30DA|nr:hypothetical protein [Klebsiella quasipneumoniae]MEB5816688.1 hypothetical protein [Klebsiella quasipneumoniae]
MNDITDLAQREKFEAWLSEKPLHARYMHWSNTLNAYDYTGIQLAWEAYQAGGTELAETLNKAQCYIEELREWNASLAQESFERQQRISELLEGKVGSALLERENHHVEVVGKLTEHIDQLESRIVTVKLPYTPEPSAFAPWAAKAFYQFHKDTVKSCAEAFSEACSAAGVKLEIK